MSITLDFPQNVCRLSRQNTIVNVPSSVYVQPLRRHNTSFDFLHLSRKNQNDNVLRHRAMDIGSMTIVKNRGTSRAPDNSPVCLSRSDSICSFESKTDTKTSWKFPVLGPTRQQTETYFKKRNNELQRLTLPGGCTTSLDLNKHERTLLDSDDEAAKLRASFGSLTTTSLLGDRPKISEKQSLGDVRFLAELVKPMQYRLRFSKKQEKVLFPSKYGYHRRSHSPTFKRLVKATEKLEILARERELTDKPRVEVKQIEQALSTQQSLHNIHQYGCNRSPNIPEAYSDSGTSTRNANSELSTPRIDPVIIPIKRGFEIPHEHPLQEDAISEEDDVDEEDDDDDDISEDTSENYFKVDFRVNDESQAQLHLFLPKINDSDGKKDRFDSGSEKNNKKRVSAKLPNISRSSSNSNLHKNQSGPRKIKKDVTRKKKRKLERIKSAADNDRRIKDHLNDVATLMSLEREFEHKPHYQKHSDDQICPFENCPYHSNHDLAVS